MAESGARRLVITDDDVAAPPNPPAAAATTAGAAYPAVDGGASGGHSPSSPGPHLWAPTGTSAGALARLANLGTFQAAVAAAVTAGLLGWLVIELLTSDESALTLHPHLVREAARDFAAFTGLFAAIFAAWDDAVAGVWDRAARSAGVGLAIGLPAGAASGALAQHIYGKLVESILRHSGLLMSPTDIRLDLARGLGWALLGVGIGVAGGAARRSGRKAVNGAIGGALGGFAGGFLFNFIGSATSSGMLSRLGGFGVGSLLIGAAIGVVEVARRQAWVQVVGGGMTGKEFILYHQVTSFGSSPKCEITLVKDGAIAPFHFRISEHGGSRRALEAFQGATVSVNGSPVTSHWLRPGDVVGVGATSLRYLERAVPV